VWRPRNSRTALARKCSASESCMSSPPPAVVRWLESYYGGRPDGAADDRGVPCRGRFDRDPPSRQPRSATHHGGAIRFDSCSRPHVSVRARLSRPLGPRRASWAPGRTDTGDFTTCA
jgi:hypothetical protein